MSDYLAVFGDGTPPGGDPYADDPRLDDKQRAVLRSQGVPLFEGEVTFLATVKGAKITTGGDMDVILSVPQGEKYRAIPITDAVGLMLVVQCRRKKSGL